MQKFQQERNPAEKKRKKNPAEKKKEKKKDEQNHRWNFEKKFHLLSWKFQADTKIDLFCFIPLFFLWSISKHIQEGVTELLSCQLRGSRGNVSSGGDPTSRGMFSIVNEHRNSPIQFILNLSEPPGPTPRVGVYPGSWGLSKTTPGFLAEVTWVEQLIHGIWGRRTSEGSTDDFHLGRLNLRCFRDVVLVS